MASKPIGEALMEEDKRLRAALDELNNKLKHIEDDLRVRLAGHSRVQKEVETVKSQIATIGRRMLEATSGTITYEDIE